MSGTAATARAQDLKAGQRVYIGRLGRWCTLSADAKTHRLSRNLIRLEFAEIPNEYRRVNEAVQVRPPRRRVGADAGREL
jgi:hypothetical protein